VTSAQSTSLLPSALERATRGSLSADDFARVLDEVVVEPLDEDSRGLRFAALLGLLTGRGATRDELLGAVCALDARAVQLAHDVPDAIDTCGTGGDGAGTVNLSTGAALLVSALGVPVAKHGNRAVGSRSGSADVLVALGVPIDDAPERLAQRLAEERFAFLFAPRFHPALAAIADLRRALGLRTVLNLAAPLANPARVRRQVVGVADLALAPLFVAVLAARDTRAAYVVATTHDSGVVDELVPCGTCRAFGVGGLPDLEFEPERFGLPRVPLAALRCSGPEHSAALVRAAFEGAPGPVADALALNAAAALVVAGAARDLLDGLEAARMALARGTANRHLARLARGGVA
jgi:anthranilate phosphoribosyltransferase